MSLRKRMSVSSTSSRSDSPLAFTATPNVDAEEWIKTWGQVVARGTSAAKFFKDV